MGRLLCFSYPSEEKTLNAEIAVPFFEALIRWARKAGEGNPKEFGDLLTKVLQKSVNLYLFPKVNCSIDFAKHLSDEAFHLVHSYKRGVSLIGELDDLGFFKNVEEDRKEQVFSK